MKFIEEGPDIPDDLIAMGEVVFVCGAGVSKTAGLPLFGELVEQVYRALNEPFNDDGPEEPAEKQAYDKGDYDRVLRALEKRTRPPGSVGSRVREQVANLLRPSGAPLDAHHALLGISRDANGRPRLLTTNFDTLFERAWRDSSDGKLASSAAVSLPAPGSPRDHGVLHLHGRIADDDLHLEETDLVLTSADFGDAYLRSGWAARHLADRLRIHTFVLVGYAAEDAAMRLLLDALDADRERFPDLKRVFAFDQRGDDAKHVEASWKAKGIEPLLYDDHDHLYASLREWARYTQDAFSFAAAAFTETLGKEASAATDFERQRVLFLLPRHDGQNVLAEINPSLSWLEVFQNAGLIGPEASRIRPDRWIAKGLDDPKAIAACVDIVRPDAGLAFVIDRALRDVTPPLPKIYEKAWRLISKAAKEPDPRTSLDWFTIEERLKSGEVGHDVQRGIAAILRPRLRLRPRLSGPWRAHLVSADAESVEPERLEDLFRAEMVSDDWPTHSEVLAGWPQDASAHGDDQLLEELTIELKRAVAEAKEADLIDDHFDCSDQDVSSLSEHPQNNIHSGFYPIVRVMAEVWERLAVKDPTLARRVADNWLKSDQRLRRRLALHAANNAIYPADVAARMLLAVNDRDFYCSGAQRETMKLMAERWHEFPEDRRQRIEERLIEGPSGTLFSDDANALDEVRKDQDRQRFIRLARIEATNGVLSLAAKTTLQELRATYPEWRAGPGDRDDFLVWHQSYHGGPRGDVSLLDGIPDDELIERALTLQKEQPFKRGELWRVFCLREPDRALNGLAAAAKQDDWREEAWHDFLSEADRKDVAGHAEKVAALLFPAPDDLLNALGASVTQWLETAWSALSAVNGSAFGLWDRLAEAILGQGGTQQPRQFFNDILNEAINRASGHLVQILVDQLVALSPSSGQGLPNELRTRFERLATAEGDAGLLARVVFASRLSFLHAVDPDWTAAHLVPRFSWTDPEAAALWSARRYDGIGAATLFGALREPFLALFARDDVEEEVKKDMAQRLVIAALSERRGGPPVGLQPAEVRRALRWAGGAARAAAAMFLSDLLKDTAAEDRPKVWREVVGPTLEEIWPLDADLREPDSAARLATLALRAGEAFPEALDAVSHFLLPGATASRMVISFLMENGKPSEEGNTLTKGYPHEVAQLLRATVEDDLDDRKRADVRAVLDQLKTADIQIANSPSCYSLERRVQKRGR